MTREELIEKIQGKIKDNQSGDITGNVLQEILIDILDIKPTVIDLSTLRSGETYTAEQLAEIGLTQEAMQKIADNPSAFVIREYDSAYSIQSVDYLATDSVFNIFAGLNSAGTSFDTVTMFHISGDKTDGYEYTRNEV